MVVSTNIDIFHTTNKGLGLVNSKYVLLNGEFYKFSLQLQIMFMIIFLIYFVMTIFRIYKKIKNPKFKI